MRFFQHTLLGLLLCTSALAQTKGVIKRLSDNGLTEPLVVPSGQTLTVKPGATIIAESGATVTGFSSGGTWGSITGTLSNQTDLQAALNAKSPLASPTFTGIVTIPSGASIAGYLTTVSAASTYLTQAAAAGYVSLSGSYADPNWITSLAKSKVGLGSVENTALSTWAGSTAITTLGTITTGTVPVARVSGDATPSAAGLMAALDKLKLDAQQAAETVASAGTTGIGGKAEVVTITGTTTITSFGAGTEGERHLLVFAGALTLTHHATSLVIPGAASLTTAAGDRVQARCLGGSNWQVEPIMTNAAGALLNFGLQVGGSGNRGVGGIVGNSDITCADTSRHLVGARGGWGASSNGVLRATNHLQTAYAQLQVAGMTGSVASGANTAAADMLIEGPRSTGNATPARIIHRVAAVGSSGSTAQTLRDQMTVAADGVRVKVGEGNGVAALGGAYSSQVGDVTEPDGDVETDLHSVPFPVNSFTRDGSTMTVDIDYSLSATIEGATMRIKVAGNTVLTVSADAIQSGNGSLKLVLTRLSSGTLQWRLLHEIQPEYTTMVNAKSEVSVSFTGSLSVVVTGQSGPGGLVHVTKTLADWRPAY